MFDFSSFLSDLFATILPLFGLFGELFAAILAAFGGAG